MAWFIRPLREPGLCGMDFCTYVYGCIHPRKKRSHLVGFLTFVCNRHHLSCLYRTRGGVSPLRTSQLLFQVVNFPLQGFVVILPLEHVPHPRTAFACVGGSYTTLSMFVLIFFPFKVKKVFLPLVGFSTFVCNRRHLPCQYLNQRGTAFIAHVVASFLGRQFPTVGLCCHLAFGTRDSSPSNGFCLFGWFINYLLDVCPDLFPIQG